MVRVRFAPSPTGFLHVGGARTALFNWLFARHHGGTFVLRIEDTDQERSTKEFDDDILRGLRWLGMDWDEGPDIGGPYGPYRQRERLDRYRAAADTLIASGRMYKCFCTSEELEVRRQTALAKGDAPKYDGRCGKMSPGEAEKLAGEGKPWVWRFRINPKGATGGSPRGTPEGSGETVVDDVIRGKVSFQNDLLDDLVVMKPDGMPTYNFAVVVDDHEMAISHVIRGEDHLSNTPRQWMIYEALGWTPPRCGHLPLILGPDKTRLSKRHGATAVHAYEEQGVLPEALMNFLSLLGWSLNDKDQVAPLKEIIEKFSLERVSKSPAVFDVQKLEWMNGVYLRNLPLEEVVRRAWPRFVKLGWVTGAAGSGAEWERMCRIVKLEQERIKYVAELEESVKFFFEEPATYDEKAAGAAAQPAVWDALKAYREEVNASASFLPAELEAQARGFVERRGIKLKDIAQGVRLSLTGKTVSPPLFDTMAELGRDACVKRLDRALAAWAPNT